MRPLRAETVIATHTNADFDAFASLLAVRRLYEGAVAALPGSLARNVREFYRLHADELDVCEAARLDLTAIERLVVVETVHASRLGELEPVALDPSVEKVVFDHHGDDLPEWVTAETAVISDDGALTTTLVGVLAEREIPVTPLEATVFALGIHEDTGSLTYVSATQRDAEAFAWCLRHGASQELLAQFLHAPLGDDERDLLAAILEGLEPHDVAGVEVLVASVAGPGVVAREDLDRAVAHGLSHAPVKAVMSGRAATAAPETPVGELQSLLAAGNERVAVLEGDRIAGVVTRSDVLRSLGAQMAPPPQPGPMLTEELARLERLQRVFETVAAVSE